MYITILFWLCIIGWYFINIWMHWFPSIICWNRNWYMQICKCDRTRELRNGICSNSSWSASNPFNSFYCNFPFNHLQKCCLWTSSSSYTKLCFLKPHHKVDASWDACKTLESCRVIDNGKKKADVLQIEVVIALWMHPCERVEKLLSSSLVTLRNSTKSPWLRRKYFIIICKMSSNCSLASLEQQAQCLMIQLINIPWQLQWVKQYKILLLMELHFQLLARQDFHHDKNKSLLYTFQLYAPCPRQSWERWIDDVQLQVVQEWY